MILAKPLTIASSIKNIYNVEKLSAGIFRIKLSYYKEIIFVLLNQLELNEHNYFLGLFATKNYVNAIEIA